MRTNAVPDTGTAFLTTDFRVKIEDWRVKIS